VCPVGVVVARLVHLGEVADLADRVNDSGTGAVNPLRLSVPIGRR
jgi:hypothetical protein